MFGRVEKELLREIAADHVCVAQLLRGLLEVLEEKGLLQSNEIGGLLANTENRLEDNYRKLHKAAPMSPSKMTKWERFDLNVASVASFRIARKSWTPVIWKDHPDSFEPLVKP